MARQQLLSTRTWPRVLASLSIVSLCLYIFRASFGPSSPPPHFRHEFPYSRTVVIPRTQDSNHNWMHEQIPDLLDPVGQLSTTFYSVDDPEAKHHTPANRGNEAMVYLTYLIDFYDAFPDVTIFLHGGAVEWHNPHLLNSSTALILRQLNLDKVVRDGYVNLLCEWQGNCPAHLHPHAAEHNPAKPEEAMFVDVWPELFEGERAPEVLAQACCSQFAVSRERLQAVPRATYSRLREWLLTTWMDDHDSGRIFEYVWQYLFTGDAVFCPDPMLCYCELYGVCFARKEQYEEFFALRRGLHCREEELQQLDEWDSREEMDPEAKALLEAISDDWEAELAAASILPLDDSGMPEAGLREKLLAKAEEKKGKMAALQRGALEYGSDPRHRAAAIKARKKPSKALLDGVQCNREVDA